MSAQQLIIDSRAVEPFWKNGYLLASAKSRQGVYIDPGDEVAEMLSRVGELGVTLLAVVNTHAHLDHISGISKLLTRWEIPIFLHPEDAELYRQLPAQAALFGLKSDPPPPVDRWMRHGEVLLFGDLELRVHHTPGHSPGHVCLQNGRDLFCGDTVFAGSIGRTDLPGGSREVLLHSIQDVILPLGDDTILHPGHGPETSVGRERTSNPFLV